MIWGWVSVLNGKKWIILNVCAVAAECFTKFDFCLDWISYCFLDHKDLGLTNSSWQKRERNLFFFPPLFSRSKHNFRWQWLGACLSGPWHPLLNGSTEACELNSSADIFHASIDVWKKVNCEKSCLVLFFDLMMSKALPTDCLEQIHYHSIRKRYCRVGMRY